ncbi:hypothetical protein G6F22_016656 [Rhizopus arrhizus]|nr:hypothetical protein G6F22_016656 [Rhizopus arrhizus]
MKVGTIATSSNFFAYTALMKPASEKIVAPRITVHDHAHHQAAQHGTGYVTPQDHPVRHRADQQFLHVAAELGAEERGADVAVAVLDHAHHHQARHDELHVGVAAHVTHARPDQVAEDQEVQGHGDRRRHQGLAPDAHDAGDFAAHDGHQRDAVALAGGQLGGAHAEVSRPR